MVVAGCLAWLASNACAHEHSAVVVKPAGLGTVQSAASCILLPSSQAAEPLFEAAYTMIGKAVENMSEEEQAKEIKQMKPTVSGKFSHEELQFA